MHFNSYLFTLKFEPRNGCVYPVSVEPSLHELPLVLRAVREPHDADAVREALLELPVVRRTVGNLKWSRA